MKLGSLPSKKFGPQFHLLDDGFQHRALARDFDIVLVNSEDSHDRLLPAGRLREPLDFVAPRRCNRTYYRASPESLPLSGKLLWRVQRGILARDVPSRPVVFCGIARPQNFVAQLRAKWDRAGGEKILP